MFKNYIKTAFRNFYKNKSFTFINIFGIVSGMTVSIIILQYVIYQFSFDSSIKDASHIYRVRTEVSQDAEVTGSFATAPAPLAPMMKKDFPEVVEITRLYNIPSGIVKYNDISFNETKIYCVDQSFFKIFNYPIVKGTPPNGKQGNHTVIITESVARKYFGNDDPIDKVIELDGLPMTVRGVMADVPRNSHFQINFLFPIENVLQSGNNKAENWTALSFHTYALLGPGTNIQDLQKKTNSAANKHKGELFGDEGRDDEYFLQPLKDIHLYSHLLYELDVNGDGEALRFLLVLAVFVLCIAWLNYINLSTASNLKRTKEVGVRLAMGAHRSQLIYQFLCGAMMINLIAAILSLAIVYFIQGILQKFVAIDLPFEIWKDYNFWLTFCGIFLIGTLLSGGVPAFVISSLKPYTALKGRIKSSFAEIFMRKGFTIVQFIFSAFLITSTIVVSQQMFFIKNQDIGINIEKTLTIKMPFFLQRNGENIDYFMIEVEGFNTIKSVTTSSLIPGIEYNNTVEVQKANSDEKSVVQLIGIDNHFISSFEIDILEGRGYDKNYRTTDTEAILINKAAAKLLGIENLNDEDLPKIEISNVACEVIGITKDFSHRTLKSRPDPVIFYWRPRSEYISIKIADSENVPKTIKFVEAKYKEIFGGAPFEYFFLDDLYNDQYKSDEQFMRLFKIFSYLSIIISSLGLLGLNMFNVEQRVKEIGVRKILGASFVQVLFILLKDMLFLILIGNVIAAIAVYFAMNQWLQTFALKVTMEWWWFLAATLIIMIIALVTVSYHTIKASLASPVKALRHE